MTCNIYVGRILLPNLHLWWQSRWCNVCLPLQNGRAVLHTVLCLLIPYGWLWSASVTGCTWIDASVSEILLMNSVSLQKFTWYLLEEKKFNAIAVCKNFEFLLQVLSCWYSAALIRISQSSQVRGSRHLPLRTSSCSVRRPYNMDSHRCGVWLLPYQEADSVR